MGGLQSVYGFNVGVGSVAAAAQVATDAKDTKDATNTKDATLNPQREVVVIAVDQSEHAAAAFEWYCKRLHRPSDVVHVVHCLEIGPPNYPVFEITASMYADNIANAKKAAESLTANYNRCLQDSKINGQVHNEVGKPGEEVIKSVEKYNATHIIMGTRGFGMLRRTVLGSVSQYVLHHTKVPVTVVPLRKTSGFFQ